LKFGIFDMNNLLLQFIPKTEASELKDLGFDEPCFGWYLLAEGGANQMVIPEKCPKQEIGLCLAPTFSQAFCWFREKHKLVHEITSFKYKGGSSFDYDVFSLVLPTDDELGDEDDIASDKTMETYDSLVEKDFRHNESESYEDAELACLKKLIEIVKNK